jgi:hypothetical protein
VRTACAGLLLTALPATVRALEDPPSTAPGPAATLHEAPQPRIEPSGPAAAGQQRANRLAPFPVRYAPKYADIIEPEYKPQSLNGGEKFFLSIREIVSYHYPLSVVVAAGLSQGLDSNPKYGQDSEAFAQRVGAAAARQASQAIFSDGILAPLLHEDPRYYVLGSGHGFFSRAIYAADRVVITRTYGGKERLNISEIAGYAASAGLTQAYYPPRSQDAGTVLTTWGVGLAGSAVRNEIVEFLRFFVPRQPRP